MSIFNIAPIKRIQQWRYKQRFRIAVQGIILQKLCSSIDDKHAPSLAVCLMCVL